MPGQKVLAPDSPVAVPDVSFVDRLLRIRVYRRDVDDIRGDPVPPGRAAVVLVEPLPHRLLEVEGIRDRIGLSVVDLSKYDLA